MRASTPTRRRAHRRQGGIALATVLFLIVVLSVLAAAVLYSTQLETISAYNYGASTRALYVADAGTQAAMNWFENNYTPQPITSYNISYTPVQYGSAAVVINGVGNGSNYPDMTTVKSFQDALGNLKMGGGAGKFTVNATLVALRPVTTINGPGAQERWRLDTTGAYTVAGISLATAKVSVFVEKSVTPVLNFAMFSLSKTCGSLVMSGGAQTDSYNSSKGTYAQTVSTTTGGDIGSDGNIQSSGNVTVGGNVLVPYGTVGKCGAGNPGSITMSGGVTVDGKIYNMTAPIAYTVPSTPAACVASLTCAALPGNNVLAPATCTSATPAVCTPSYGDISLASSANLTLPGGTVGNPAIYVVNSITQSGQATITVSPAGPVILKIVGSGTTTPLTLTGGGVLNSSPPTNLLMEYGGTGSISVAGGTTSNYVLYAPYAAVTVAGSAAVYGAIIGGTVNAGGGAPIHYDQALRNTYQQLGPFQNVSWNRIVN